MNPHKIWQLSDTEIGELVLDNFDKLGFRVKPNSEELTKLVKEVYRYQGKVQIDTFNEAFSLFAAGEIEVKERMTLSAYYIGRVIKAFMDRNGHNVANRVVNKPEETLSTPTDKDYFETFIFVIEGRQSERHKERYGNKPDPITIHPEYYPMIPMFYAYEEVYRYLLTLNEVEHVSGYEKQKKQVKYWIISKYPNAIDQVERFGKSPAMTGKTMGQRIRQSLGV